MTSVFSSGAIKIDNSSNDNSLPVTVQAGSGDYLLQQSEITFDVSTAEYIEAGELHNVIQSSDVSAIDYSSLDLTDDSYAIKVAITTSSNGDYLTITAKDNDSGEIISCPAPEGELDNTPLVVTVDRGNAYQSSSSLANGSTVGVALGSIVSTGDNGINEIVARFEAMNTANEINTSISNTALLSGGGTITVPTSPISFIGSSTGAITNTGTITNTSSGIPVDLGSTFSVTSGVGITNTGTITSTSLGVISSKGYTTVDLGNVDILTGPMTNTGTIINIGSKPVTGLIDLSSSSKDTINNYGKITNEAGTVIKIDSPNENTTIYNYGKITKSDSDAISFGGGYGKVVNAGIIEGDVTVDASHEGDYVLRIGGVEDIEIVGDEGFVTELNTGDVLGVVKGDTNFVQGNIGTENDDIIEADDNAQNIFGLDGDDWIFAFDGDDVVYAGAGDDMVSAGSGNDKITGGEGNDFISGGAGKDIIAGGEGKDQIISGEGRDVLFGGLGNDVFIFSEADSQVGDADIIMDFEQGEDKISLVGNVDSFDELSFFKFNGNTAIASTDEDNYFVLYLKGDYELEAGDFYFGAGNNTAIGSVASVDSLAVCSMPHVGIADQSYENIIVDPILEVIITDPIL